MAWHLLEISGDPPPAIRLAVERNAATAPDTYVERPETETFGHGLGHARKLVRKDLVPAVELPLRSQAADRRQRLSIT